MHSLAPGDFAAVVRRSSVSADYLPLQSGGLATLMRPLPGETHLGEARRILCSMVHRAAEAGQLGTVGLLDPSYTGLVAACPQLPDILPSLVTRIRHAAGLMAEDSLRFLNRSTFEDGEVVLHCGLSRDGTNPTFLDVVRSGSVRLAFAVGALKDRDLHDHLGAREMLRKAIQGIVEDWPALRLEISLPGQGDLTVEDAGRAGGVAQHMMSRLITTRIRAMHRPPPLHPEPPLPGKDLVTDIPGRERGTVRGGCELTFTPPTHLEYVVDRRARRAYVRQGFPALLQEWVRVDNAVMRTAVERVEMRKRLARLRYATGRRILAEDGASQASLASWDARGEQLQAKHDGEMRAIREEAAAEAREDDERRRAQAERDEAIRYQQNVSEMTIRAMEAGDDDSQADADAE